jgi:hypothetical protein
VSTIVEQMLLDRWKTAAYRHHGRCATCGCTHDEAGRPLLLAGVNLGSLVCFPCFADEHDGRFPNYRRRPREGMV